MKEWSWGEVKKPETINYRTFKPERDGLFCERIFGPVKDWECHCGRYKKVKFKGVTCDRCGVEITRSKVRRERMGHIELAAPVSHIWYLKGVPSPMSLLLDISPRPLEKVIYFGSYIVTHVDKRRILDELAEIEVAVADEIRELREGRAPEPTLITPEALAAVDVEPLLEDEEEEETEEEVVAEETEAETDADADVDLDPAVAPELAVAHVVSGDAEAGTSETVDAVADPLEATEEADLVDEADLEDADTEAEAEDTPEAEPEPIETSITSTKNLEDRITELEDALNLLKQIDKRALIVEDQWRGLERLLEVASRRLNRNYSNLVRAGLGAAAIKEALTEIDLDELARQLRTEISQTQGPRRARAVKRLEVVDSFLKSKSRPEWMILDVITVIPPELRPMVQLDGGRFATSDLNDLYRRIINRNNRLKKITEIRAPESIINHEKRLLQEAVDALIDNGRRSRPVVGSNNRPLRSLSDMLKGKEGRFRKNLLGKRVDYSGRSVIVVGPKLKLHQCGLPKEMALELFKPFVMKTLVEKNYTTSIKTAKRMMDRVRPEVWDALEEVIKDHPVLLNRAPTLHRMGIQAFMPVLVDGKAIQLHPLVCVAFGADFDGDQMAVHVPLSTTAQAEARMLMLSHRNIFSLADGQPIAAPKQDIVLGLYYLTQINENAKGAGLLFRDAGEAMLAYDMGKLHLHAPIKVGVRGRECGVCGYFRPGQEAPETCTNPVNPCTAKAKDYGPTHRQYIETTVGRLYFNQMLPDEPDRVLADDTPLAFVDKSPSTFRNREMVSGGIAGLIKEWNKQHGWGPTVQLLDDLKENGFRFATQSGITIAVTDMEVPEERNKIIRKTEEDVAKQNRHFRRGQITQGEREQAVLQLWTKAFDDVANAILGSIDKFNPVYMISNSGARGSKKQITQLSGMRGVMSDPFGRMIEELPIKSNFHEGLSVLEYFISTHGQRKGLADTALRTADAGYLTRRLVDVAQDVIIRAPDCGTNQGIYVSKIEGETPSEPDIESLGNRIRGRVSLERLAVPREDGTEELIWEANEIISDEAATRVDEIDAKAVAEGKEPVVGRVGVRSVLTCELRKGICAMCYGRDMARNQLVEEGTAVGIIAAQSIGEPGTQLTMRTFHTGGIAGQHITGVAGVKRKKQEALQQLHEDARRGLVTLGEGMDRERSKAVQGMLKVLEEQVRGLLRVVELVEARTPKGQAIISEYEGTVIDIEEKRGLPEVVIESVVDTHELERVVGEELSESLFPIALADGTEAPVKKTRSRKKVVEEDEESGPRPLIAAGTDLTEKVCRQIRELGYTQVKIRRSYLVPYRGSVKGKDPVSNRERYMRAGRVELYQKVRAGDRLTEGPLDPEKVLQLQGIRGVQDYLVREIQTVYIGQAQEINDKHIEVIVRQMLRKLKILDPGDTLFMPGQVVDAFEFRDANERVGALDPPGRPATGEWMLLGITYASLATDSFLSAASFQKTTKVLAEAAIRGKEDTLVGLKENVIIGRLIPAGTGHATYRHQEERKAEDAARKAEQEAEAATATERARDFLGGDMGLGGEAGGTATLVREPELRTLPEIPAFSTMDEDEEPLDGSDGDGYDGDGEDEDHEEELGLDSND
jgi:DNA-directed RNA polymerase subunit beta'